MTIAIIGAGQVGQALAKNLTRQGEAIVFGVSDPAKYRAVAARIGPEVRVGTIAEAVAVAERAVLAVPYQAAGPLAASIPDWRGKILIDATNPLAPNLAAQVVALAARMGFEAVALGGLTAARYLEPFAMTWIYWAHRLGNGPDCAFGVLRRGR